MEQDNKWPRGRLALKLSDNQDIPPEQSVDNYRGKWEFFYAPTGRVLDAVDDASIMQARAVLADTQRHYDDLPADQIQMRKADKVQDVEPNVAQNFTAQQGEQEVDGTGEPIWQIYQVGNGLVMSEITAGDQQEAAQALQDQLDDWATDDDVRELYAVRPKMVEQSAQSTPPDATEQTGTWQIVDVTLNQPVETFQGTWAQAERIAQQYETGAGEHNGHELSVRRA
jgi:hypothetical protein